MEKIRMFISVDIGAQKKIIALGKKLKEIESSLRFVDPHNIHLTLKFLGDTDISLLPCIKKVMSQSVQEKKPFQIQLRGIGVFPNLNYIKIIWIGTEIIDEDQNILSHIAEKINEGLSIHGFQKEKKFHPHATIARVKKISDKERLQKLITNATNESFGTIKVTHIDLRKSKLTPSGPIYDNLLSIKI
jgi:2'-5' RNA ligase